MEGAESIPIFREQVSVRARITSVNALSAHADANELLGWLRRFHRPPRRTFLVHGEDEARAALAAQIHHELGWDVRIPTYGEQVALA